MSLEEKIDALTAALNRNSDLLEGLTAKAASAQSVKAAEKPAEKPADEKVTEPAKRGRPAKAEKPKKAPTEAEMVDATKKFMNVEAEDEYRARVDFVKSVVAKYGVQKMSHIPEEHRAAALESLENYRRGEPDDEDDGEDDLA